MFVTRRNSGLPCPLLGTCALRSGAPRSRDTPWMASANLDLVRSIVADWERGDFSTVEWADPGIEYVIADGPTPGRWSGLTGMMEGSRTFLSAWEDWRAKPEEYREQECATAF